MNLGSGLAGVRRGLVPSGPTGFVLRLRSLPVGRREFRCAATRNVVRQIRRVGMHRNFLTAFGLKVEHPHLVVLQQHLEVIWRYLHGVLRAGRWNSLQQHLEVIWRYLHGVLRAGRWNSDAT